MTKKETLKRLTTELSRRGITNPITLAAVLHVIKKKFKLKSLESQITMVVGAWKWDRDDLRKQPKYVLDLLHYFIFIPLPKQHVKR